MNILAFFAAIAGALVGGQVTYKVVKRQWWYAGGMAAFGVAVLLNIVTAGVGSFSEHLVIAGVGVVLMVVFLVATRLQRGVVR